VGGAKIPTILVADVDRAHAIAMPDEPAALIRTAEHAAPDLAAPMPTLRAGAPIEQIATRWKTCAHIVSLM